jgi:hypothetical protein
MKPVIPLAAPYRDTRLGQLGCVKLPEQRSRSRKAGAETARRRHTCQHRGGKAPGLSSMVNICELLINVVTRNKPKMLLA